MQNRVLHWTEVCMCEVASWPKTEPISHRWCWLKQMSDRQERGHVFLEHCSWGFILPGRVLYQNITRLLGKILCLICWPALRMYSLSSFLPEFGKVLVKILPWPIRLRGSWVTPESHRWKDLKSFKSRVRLIYQLVLWQVEAWTMPLWYRTLSGAETG